MQITFDALKTTGGGIVAVAIGLVDAWHFQKFGIPADIVFMTAGLAAFGVSAAFNAGITRGMR